MPCSKKKTDFEKDINTAIDNILKKVCSGNRVVKKSRKQKKNKPRSDSRKCQIVETEEVSDGIKSSARFSIRVMEAMRSLQRKTRNQSLTSSNIKEIIKYIKTNYHFDGDLDAQVRTVLSRICCQGFIMKIGKEDYHLVGPFANYMNNIRSHEISNPPRHRKRKHRSKSGSKSKSKSRSRSGSRSSGSGGCGAKRRKRGKGRKKKKGGKKKRPISKITRDTESKNLGGCSSKNQDGGSKKSKKLKRKKCCPLSPRCKCGCFGKRKKKAVDVFSLENSTIGDNIFESGLKFRKGKSGPSLKMSEKITSNSEKGGSEDSVYQKLKTKNSKTGGCNSKDLKRWIKQCRKLADH